MREIKDRGDRTCATFSRLDERGEIAEFFGLVSGDGRQRADSDVADGLRRAVLFAGEKDNLPNVAVKTAAEFLSFGSAQKRDC